jgi:signal transduction histidine kinase/CheY-like chemotaxis protein
LSNEIKYIKLIFRLFLIGITVVTGISLSYNILKEKADAEYYARIECIASYNKDILYRRWASMHGGVYVPITEITPPNKYLAHIKDRDITTSLGKQLTLINPAYMTRQVFEYADHQDSVKGHITSLNPLRPENKADEWETKVLKLFNTGIREYSSIENFREKPYMRYMRAMMVEKSCLKCHANQGYAIGQVRGGISVSVPLERFYNTSKEQIQILALGHFAIYFLAIFISILGYRQLIKEISKRNIIQQRIVESETQLKYKNQEYESLNEELMATNNDLYNAKEKAEESDRLKTAFLQNMSHEIRTPMNAIMGFSDLLRRNINNTEKLDHYTKIIKNRSEDLLEIINGILDTAKIESGQLTIHQETCNVEEIFKELQIFFTEHAKKTCKEHIAFTIGSRCDSLDFIISTDKVKLKQILINLINNAYKFTDEGEIEVGCTIDNEKLIFRVRDTGIGIPEDMQSVIFERFMQVDNGTSRTYGGTGLGLSIVKGLVHALNGDIWIKSEQGKGSTFYFAIPCHSAEQTSQLISQGADQQLLDSTNKTILIVEDDSFNLELLKEVLSITNYQIVECTSGMEAIRMVSTQSIDLILMDIRLPDISGYEAVRQIRGIHPNIYIIAQTAYAAPNDSKKALDAGCNDYVSKPIRPTDILKRITSILG